MEVVQVVNRSNFKNEFEKFYIKKETQMNNQIKARFAEGQNTTFETIFYQIHPK
jgi:hypothetical protein